MTIHYNLDTWRAGLNIANLTPLTPSPTSPTAKKSYFPDGSSYPSKDKGVNGGAKHLASTQTRVLSCLNRLSIPYHCLEAGLVNGDSHRQVEAPVTANKSESSPPPYPPPPSRPPPPPPSPSRPLAPPSHFPPNHSRCLILGDCIDDDDFSVINVAANSQSDGPERKTRLRLYSDPDRHDVQRESLRPEDSVSQISSVRRLSSRDGHQHGHGRGPSDRLRRPPPMFDEEKTPWVYGWLQGMREKGLELDVLSKGPTSESLSYSHRNEALERVERKQHSGSISRKSSTSSNATVKKLDIDKDRHGATTTDGHFEMSYLEPPRILSHPQPPLSSQFYAQLNKRTEQSHICKALEQIENDLLALSRKSSTSSTSTVKKYAVEKATEEISLTNSSHSHSRSEALLHPPSPSPSPSAPPPSSHPSISQRHQRRRPDSPTLPHHNHSPKHLEEKPHEPYPYPPPRKCSTSSSSTLSTPSTILEGILDLNLDPDLSMDDMFARESEEGIGSESESDTIKVFSIHKTCPLSPPPSLPPEGPLPPTPRQRRVRARELRVRDEGHGEESGRGNENENETENENENLLDETVFKRRVEKLKGRVRELLDGVVQESHGIAM